MALLHKCNIEKVTAHGCASLLVDGGGTAMLDGCNISGSKQGHACVVHGSHLAAGGSTFGSSKGVGLLAGARACIELDSCVFQGSKEGQGMSVRGQGRATIMLLKQLCSNT